MLTDHVGMVFFPRVPEFRMVGRLAFPIFAWLIANGYRHTGNLKAYFGRLAFLAVVSQTPYMLAKSVNFGTEWQWNIFVTLLLGLGSIVVWDRAKYLPIKLLGVVVLALAGEALAVDYKAYGVLLMMGFHLTWNRKWWMGVMMAGLNLGFNWMEYLTGYWLRAYAMVAWPMIAAYNGQPGLKKWKWAFYWFYPVHLGLLWFIAMVARGKIW